MQISETIGLVALIVTGLVVLRSVQRRRDLVLTLSDIVINLGVELETRGNRLWNRETRGLAYPERFAKPPSRLLSALDRITETVFAWGWKLERVALGQNHYNPWRGDGSAFGLSAASPYADADYIGYDDYDEDEFTADDCDW